MFLYRKPGCRSSGYSGTCVQNYPKPWTINSTGIILFGSQARGEARLESDVDVLVVVKDEQDYGDLIQRTSDRVGRLSLEYDIVISRAFVSRERYDHEESPFLINVRREGVPA